MSWELIIETTAGDFKFTLDTETRPRAAVREVLSKAVRELWVPVVTKWSLNYDSYRANYITVDIDGMRALFYLLTCPEIPEWFEALTAVSEDESGETYNMYYREHTDSKKRRRKRRKDEG